VSAFGDQHPITWVTASPLWSSVLGPGREDPTNGQISTMAKPSLLRFDSDQFMDDLNALLATPHPESLVDKEATPHSYRVRPPGVDDPENWEPDPSAVKLKLYQPFHGHFNLVAASLVCQLPGLPDRAVQSAHGDKVSFVMRRLNDGGELAWVDDATAKKGKAWAAVEALTKLAPTEELLPLFPVNYTDPTDGDRTRRLLVGLIPTSSRDTYRNAGLAAPQPPSGGDDRRQMVLRATVLDPLQTVQSLSLNTQTTAQRNAEAEISSPSIALSLAEFLVENMPVWKGILEDGDEPPAGDLQRPLYVWLRDHTADSGAGTKWLNVLRDVWAAPARQAICGEGGTPPTLNLLGAAGWNENPGQLDQDLLSKVTLALPTNAPTPPDAPLAPDPANEPLPKLDPHTEARYVLRCVYQRPQCGALHDPVVSARSDDFAIASHFDFDAPHRTITISLPIDTSPAGLRKFPKNVTFLLSDQLKQQMGRIKDLKSTMEGDVDDPGIDVGMICSLSIPIITICALILLMIFVVLLNLVFWWLPFFKICLPLSLSKESS
jgi:hypothetical protein